MMKRCALLGLISFALLGTASNSCAQGQFFGDKRIITIDDFAPNFTITEPGAYVFQETIKKADFSGNAITIDADNVTLDLNGEALESTAIGFSFDNGIQVNSGRSNIKIRNGLIKGFPGFGVVIFSGKTMVVEDLQVTECKNTGIRISGSGAVPVTDVTVRRCIVTKCARGIDLGFCDNLQVIGSTERPCQFNTSTDVGTFAGVSAFGAVIFQSTNVTFIRCQFNNNVSDQVGGRAVGLLVISSVNVLQCIDCEFSGNTALKPSSGPFDPIGGRSFGVLCEADPGVDSRGYQFIRCLANNNEAIEKRAAGMEIIQGRGCIIQECTANANKSSEDRVAGFALVNGIGNLIVDCQANGNLSDEAIGQGIRLQSEDSTCVINSHAKGNVGATFSLGMEMEATCTTCFFDACVAIGNGTRTTGTPIGFCIASDKDHLVQNCVASGNINLDKSAGIGFRNVASPSTNSFRGNKASGHVSNYTSVQAGTITTEDRSAGFAAGTINENRNIDEVA